MTSTLVPQTGQGAFLRFGASSTSLQWQSRQKLVHCKVLLDEMPTSEFLVDAPLGFSLGLASPVMDPDDGYLMALEDLLRSSPPELLQVFSAKARPQGG